MQMILKREREALDASEGECKRIIIPAGCHEIEKISNPCGHAGFWLVLKGTLTGGAENSWRQWENGDFTQRSDHPCHGQINDWGDWEVKIIE